MIVPKYTMILFLFILSLTFNLYSDNIAVCRKSSVSVLPKSTDKLMASPKAGGSTKKEDESSTVHQLVPSVVAAPIPSSSEGNNLTVLSTANVWNSSRCVTEFLDGLKNWEADREGTPFVPLLLQSPDTLHWFLTILNYSPGSTTGGSAASTVRRENYPIYVKALTKAKQDLKDSDADKAKLSQALKTIKTAYTATRDNMASKSKELDDAVIWEQVSNTLREQAEVKLAEAKKRLVTAESEKQDQRLLLEMARQALSKREDSSILMISMAVANVVALLKSHLPDLNVELLRKDFAVDEVECGALTGGAYDAAHEFASYNDLASLAKSGDNDSPRNT
jgi:hypothetical protein